MSLYLDVPSLKGYLRIGNTDAIDDSLLAEIVDAVELEQLARCTPATFQLVGLTVTPSTSDPNGLTVSAWGSGPGPFRWAWGDGVTDKTGGGVTTAAHVYTDPGPFTFTLQDNTGVTVLTMDYVVPLTATETQQGDTVQVPPDVYHAALMRGARLYWRRASPEGLVGLGDLGVARVPPYDRDIDALEAPWRNVVLA